MELQASGGGLRARLDPPKIFSNLGFSDSPNAAICLCVFGAECAGARSSAGHVNRSPRVQRTFIFPGTSCRACDTVKRLANAIG